MQTSFGFGKKNPVKVLQYLGLGALTTLGIFLVVSVVNWYKKTSTSAILPVPAEEIEGNSQHLIPNIPKVKGNFASKLGIAGAFAIGGLIAMLLAPEPITTTAGLAGLLSEFP